MAAALPLRPFPFPLATMARALRFVPTERALAMLALVGANALWGGSAVASKAALAHLPPLTLACLRVAVALAVLWPLVARTGRRPATGRTPLLLGVTGIAGFCAGQNLGLVQAGAATAALVNGGIPLLTALLAALTLGEQVGARRFVGSVLAFAGLVGVVAHGATGGGTGSMVGTGLLLASAVGFAAYVVIGRGAFRDGNALAVVAGSSRYGLLLLAPAAAAELAVHGGVERPTGTDLMLVLFLGGGCSGLAFVLCGYGLARLEVGYGAVFGNLKPLIGVGLAIVILGESVTVGQLIGGQSS